MLAIFRRDLWTRDLVAWYLYDLANSFVAINMTLYFSQWVVIDRKLPDLWFSISFVVPTLILVFLSTYVGSLGDRRGSHSSIFINTTLAIFLSVVAILVVGRLTSSLAAVVVVLIFYACYQFFAQLAMVPYYAFIKHICSEDTYGKVSGIGFTFSQFGNIAGLLITLPIISGQIELFGHDRLAPLIPGLIIFFILFIPIYFTFRNRKFAYANPDLPKSPSLWKTFLTNLKDSRRYPGVFNLLLAFYLFSDAITTLTLYSAIYLQNVFNIEDALKVQIFVLVLVGFGIGSFISGVISDRYKHKPVLLASLLINAITIFIISLNANPGALSTIFSVFGLTMGAVYTSSRSYMASLVPKSESGTFFGLYTFAEKFASVVGPLVWGVIIFLLRSGFPVNYRAAALAMGVLVLLGVLPLLIKDKPKLKYEVAWD